MNESVLTLVVLFVGQILGRQQLVYKRCLSDAMTADDHDVVHLFLSASSFILSLFLLFLSIIVIDRHPQLDIPLMARGTVDLPVGCRQEGVRAGALLSSGTPYLGCPSTGYQLDRALVVVVEGDVSTGGPLRRLRPAAFDRVSPRRGRRRSTTGNVEVRRVDAALGAAPQLERGRLEWLEGPSCDGEGRAATGRPAATGSNEEVVASAGPSGIVADLDGVAAVDDS